MIAMTPLEQALTAWNRTRDPDNRQPQFDDAVALGETRVFSNRNISHITGLDPEIVAGLTGKTDKTGHRLNPEALPFLYDLHLEWVTDKVCRPEAVRTIQRMGVSWRTIALLTGISFHRIYVKSRES